MGYGLNKRGFGTAVVSVFAALACTAAHALIPPAVFQETDEKYSPAVCKISYSLEITNTNSGDVNRRSAYALGVIVSEDGLIMAHGHMQIENRTPLNLKVTVGHDDDQKEYDATILKKPEDVNILFLRIETDEDVKFPYVKFTDTERLALGEPLLAVGLLSQSFDYAKSMQSFQIGAILEKPRLTYCLDSAISFGFVGGLAVNAKGEAIGVLGFDLATSEGGDIYTRSGHPLVYQANLFQKYIKNPPSEESGDEDAAWLGVFTQALTDDLAEYWSLPKDGGVVVSTVIAGSPAERAGLRSGDVITIFNDRKVTAKQDPDIAAFTKMVRESPLGEVLPIHLYRDGEPTEIRLTLSERPTAGRDANEFEDEVFGITARELTTDVRIGLNLADDVEGVIIRRIKSGSPANLARLRPNFIIQSIGGYRVTNLEDFQNAIATVAQEKPSEVTVFCRIGANTAFFRMEPRW